MDDIKRYCPRVNGQVAEMIEDSSGDYTKLKDLQEWRTEALTRGILLGMAYAELGVLRQKLKTMISMTALDRWETKKYRYYIKYGFASQKCLEYAQYDVRVLLRYLLQRIERNNGNPS